MNPQQRKILKGALATIITSIVFPPMATYHPMGGAISWNGFGFILFGDSKAVVMVSMLFAEWIAIGIICGILWRLYASAELEATKTLTGKIANNETARSAVRSALDNIKQ
jgi:hypothetical protein